MDLCRPVLLSGGGGGFGRDAIHNGGAVGGDLLGTASLLMFLFSGGPLGVAGCSGVYHAGASGGALTGTASSLMVLACGALSGATTGGSVPVYRWVSGAASWLALADAPVVKA